MSARDHSTARGSSCEPISYSAYLKTLRQAFASQYVSKADLDQLQAPFRNLPLDYRCSTASHNPFRIILQLYQINRIQVFLNHRAKHNQNFIRRWQKRGFTVEGHPLDAQQIEAVVACEDIELTLAPAGSGKTATLLGKVFYLIRELHVPIDQILLIAFNRKVVAELKERSGLPNLSIKTFHALGNDIIKQLRPDHNAHRKILREDPQIFLHKALHQLRHNPHFDSTIDEFLALVSSVINLQKSARLSTSAFYRRLATISDDQLRQRAQSWFKLYAPLYQAYANHLKQTHQYDFTDMINEAIALAEASPPHTFPYRYILVDEAQDLSQNRYRLLKAILDKSHPQAKLFAVGDDWQSINRFAGSDCALLKQFSQYFQRETYQNLIERVYRFGDPVARVSSRFVQKNPHQTRKQVKPLSSKFTDLQIRINSRQATHNPRQTSHSTRQASTKIRQTSHNHYSEIPPDYQTIDTELHHLYQKQGTKLHQKSIQIISRYNSDIERIINLDRQSFQHAKVIKCENDSYELEWRLDSPSPSPLHLSFCSMHKAKGMTRDIVFVINVNNGHHGIPATRGDDPLISLLLSQSDDFPFAEERRLFYVAITRAKELTILCADGDRASDFLYEVGADLKYSEIQVCPKCRNGILVERKNQKRGTVFYTCSNWKNGCDYTEA